MLIMLLKKLKRFITSYIDKIDLVVASLFSHSRLLSVLYYLVLDRGFGREQQAVLSGRKGYKANDQRGDNTALLRRNTHRIEKGLCMTPRRAIFATDYILETVKCYVEIRSANNTHNRDLLLWAGDVLREYFQVVDHEKTIKEAAVLFSATPVLGAPSSQTSENTKMIPYTRKNSVMSRINYKDFYDLCKQRRSVRWYKDTMVPRSLIEKAVDIARLAPSACNRQPFDFYILDDPDKVANVSSIPMGTVGFNQNIRCIVVVVGRLDAFPAGRDRHVIYIDGALASMQFMLALETLGLSSCPINWPDVERLEKKLSKSLGLKIVQRPVMLISVGFAQDDGMIPFSKKRNVSEIIKWN